MTSKLVIGNYKGLYLACTMQTYGCLLLYGAFLATYWHTHPHTFVHIHMQHVTGFEKTLRMGFAHDSRDARF